MTTVGGASNAQGSLTKAIASTSTKSTNTNSTTQQGTGSQPSRLDALLSNPVPQSTTSGDQELLTAMTLANANKKQDDLTPLIMASLAQQQAKPSSSEGSSKSNNNAQTEQIAQLTKRVEQLTKEKEKPEAIKDPVSEALAKLDTEIT